MKSGDLPFGRAQKFLEGVNQKALRTLSIARAWYPRVGLLAAFVVALIVAAYLVPHPAAGLPQGTPTLTFDIFFFAFGAFITSLCIFHLVTLGIVGNLPLTESSRKKPGRRPSRPRPLRYLYLVVDQQNRWKNELLPVPASALLDPLLIGEKRERSGSSYFLIHQFDLTKAEDYLIAEFLINPED